jgi:pimeloyl-ACP methyl ester carboxylesterase
VTHELPARLRRFEARDPRTPTLYIMGDQDHMFIDGARAMAAKHPCARLHVIERCGHVCTVERPETFNRVSLEFLAQR